MSQNKGEVIMAMVMMMIMMMIMMMLMMMMMMKYQVDNAILIKFQLSEFEINSNYLNFVHLNTETSAS